MVEIHVNEPTYTCVFDYIHVWVNDGKWHSASDEERAIIAAKSAAMDAANQGTLTLARHVLFKSSRVILDYLNCDMGHRDTCRHIRVRFYAKDQDI